MVSKKKIVILTGLKGSGKDEVAKILINKFGYKKLAFANLLKDTLASLLDWPRDGLEGTTPEQREWREKIDPKYGFSPRQALQKVGTELLRDQLYKNIWVDAVLRQIAKSKHAKFVITDCRYANEIFAFKNCPYEVHFWRVERGERPKWWRRAEFVNRCNCYYRRSNFYSDEIVHWINSEVHSSERSWQGIDNPEVIIYNNSTLTDLYYKVMRFAHKRLTHSFWGRIGISLKLYCLSD